MQQSFVNGEQLKELSVVTFLVGNQSDLVNIGSLPVLSPFSNQLIEFLNELSKRLMADSEAKAYSDIISLAFWMRKASILKIKERFVKEENNIHMGRGVAFHIAPSNVPVNYAYSLVTGLITGNANIVRIPSKDFPQVNIINKAINDVLKDMPALKEYIYLVRYERSQKINDIFSALADVRMIWGGDDTIFELRKSPLQPRATEITFADRYSLAIINAEMYLAVENKDRFAEDFYNDTYFSDQNACTSPRIVVWTGNQKKEAKELFWTNLHKFVKRKYVLQPIMGVNKLTSCFLLAAKRCGVHVEKSDDNYLIRVLVGQVDADLMKEKDNSGYFLEYDSENLMELQDLCNDTHCQTIGYLGIKEDIIPLLKSGIKGVDRVVPIGKTMDFDLIWDGYNLFERLTRIITLGV